MNVIDQDTFLQDPIFLASNHVGVHPFVKKYIISFLFWFENIILMKKKKLRHQKKEKKVTINLPLYLQPFEFF